MNPILIELPEQFDSERLVFSVPKQGEGAALNAAILESFDELHKWIPWARERPTRDESEVAVRAAHAHWILRDEIRYHLYDKKTKDLIGVIGFPRLDWKIPRFEIGYWIRTSCAGKGFATEATKRMTELAFNSLNAKRVELHIDERNLGSAAVAKKLGFQLEARVCNHQCDYVTGDPTVMLVFAKFKAD